MKKKIFWLFCLCLFLFYSGVSFVVFGDDSSSAPTSKASGPKTEVPPQPGKGGKSVPGTPAQPDEEVQPTATPTPVPSATSTPVPTPTPAPTATSTPVPTPTPTAAPLISSPATPTPVPTITLIPAPPVIPTLSLIEEQLQIAETYFNKKQFTTPVGENAFEIYQDVLNQDPANEYAREKLREMMSIYKNWGDNAYDRNDYRKAQTYYDRYVFVADYLRQTLGDQEITQEAEDVQTRLATLTLPPTPLSEVKEAPTPGAMSVPDTTPQPESASETEAAFQITGVVVKNANNTIVQPKDGVYTTVVGEAIIVTVHFTTHPGSRVGIIWTTGNGKVPPSQEKTNTYTATQVGSDYITVLIWDKDTGTELSQIIKIDVTQD